MDKYLTQKIPSTDKSEELLEKKAEFVKQLRELQASKPQMVEDLQKPLVKDLPVDKIDKRGIAQPVVSGSDFQTQQALRAARKDAIEKTSDVLDYNKLREEFKKINKFTRTGGSKMLAAVPVLGSGLALAAGLSSPDASAAVGDSLVPGGLESLGPQPGSLDHKIENGLPLSPEEKQQLAEQQARIKALQTLR